MHLMVTSSDLEKKKRESVNLF